MPSKRPSGRTVLSVAAGLAMILGAACAAPLTSIQPSPPATSVARPELLAGGQQPTRPPLSPGVAVSPLPSPLAVVSPDAVISPVASPGASPSPTPFHPVLPSGSPSTPVRR